MSLDGQRFLIVKEGEQATQAQINVVLNWFEEIKHLVVGTPGGPAEKPPRYGGAEGRTPIYTKGIRVFEVLDSREIVEKRSVPFPVEQLAYGRFRRRP